MRVYIGGPMTGYKNYNFPAFHEAQRALEKLGHVVVNPAIKESNGDFPDYDLIPEKWGGTRTDLSPGLIRNRDFRELLTCDVMMLLYGWDRSWGARLEAAVAQACGMQLYELKLMYSGCEYIAIDPDLIITTTVEYKDEGHTDAGNVGLYDV